MVYSKLFVFLVSSVTIGCTHLSNKTMYTTRLPTQETEGSKNIFDNSQILEIELTTDFPFNNFSGKPRPEVFEKFDGKMRYIAGDQQIISNIKIEARGSGRLNHCKFAPFKIIFSKNEKMVLFEGPERDFKVVSHCSHTNTQQPDLSEYIMKELLLYKMLESLGAPSFKTKPLKIAYRNFEGKIIENQKAFLIEPTRQYLARSVHLNDIIEDSTMNSLINSWIESGIKDQAGFDKKMSELIDVENHIENNLGQLLILNEDWVGSFRSGNVKTFLSKTGKVFNVHYDFDLSNLVEKFSRNQKSFTYPATVESDKKWISNFCNTDSETYIKAEEKKKACPNVIFRFSQKKESVLQTIMSFEFLDSKKKKVFYDRALVFFEALETLKL